MLAFVAAAFINLSLSAALALPDFRGQGHDFGKFLFAQFACYGPEHARAHGLISIVDEHRSIVIKADVSAVTAAMFLTGAHHDGAHHFTLFDRALRRRFFHRSGDDVAQPSAAADIAAV